MAYVISICNHKGGVGKTTTAVNIGAGLAKRGYKVLLVDMDAQANLTDTLHASAETDIYAMLRGATPTPVVINENLHVLPSTLELAAAEVELSTAIGREALLKEVIQPLKKQYNYIIIDTAPTLGLLTINAMAASDYAIIPMQAEYYALKGIRGLLDVITNVQKRINKALKIGGVIITQYDSRTTLHKQVTDAIRAQFAINVFGTCVRNSIAVAEAQAKGSDIFTYAPDSAGAKDYGAIVDEFLIRFPIL